eukprot:1623083-Rhodomonas_salina.4
MLIAGEAWPEGGFSSLTTVNTRAPFAASQIPSFPNEVWKSDVVERSGIAPLPATAPDSPWMVMRDGKAARSGTKSEKLTDSVLLLEPAAAVLCSMLAASKPATLKAAEISDDVISIAANWSRPSVFTSTPDGYWPSTGF